MTTDKFKRVLKDIKALSSGRVSEHEPMSRHTTIRVGGPARIFVEPTSSGEVIELIRLFNRRNLDYLVVGRGSNLLVRDAGYRGIVIKIAGNLARIRMNEQTVYAEAGASFSLMARKATRQKRTGLEFATGIPGSVGGAVKMNAGAYGRDVFGVLHRIRLIEAGGRPVVLKTRDLDSGYRRGGLPGDALVLSATFHCPPGRVNREIVQKSSRRKDNQPLEHRSFGCAFMNPPGGHAGRLIDQCGLKGAQKGGAVVSEKHANFILNVGEKTTAGDIEKLIRLVKREVKKQLGVTLKPEVIIVGD